MYDRQKNGVKSYLDKIGNFYELLKDNNCFIAGGMVRSIFTKDTINDVDIYFRDKLSLLKVMNYFSDESEYLHSITDKSVFFTVKRDKSEVFHIQLIFFKYFENSQEIFNTYDFTNCMGAFDFKTEEFYFHDNFFVDNLQKRLVFNEKTSYPLVSALRVDKYYIPLQFIYIISNKYT